MERDGGEARNKVACEHKKENMPTLRKDKERDRITCMAGFELFLSSILLFLPFGFCGGWVRFCESYFTQTSTSYACSYNKNKAHMI